MGKAPDIDPPAFTPPQSSTSVTLAGNKAPITPLAQRGFGGAAAGTSRMAPRSFTPQKPVAEMSQGGGGHGRLDAMMDLLRGSL